MAKKESAVASAKANPQPWYQRPRLVAMGVFLLAVMLYGNTFSHDYALDDAIVITKNAFTQQGISGLGDIFRYDTFRGFYHDSRGVDLVAGGRYRPLTLAMFAVEQSLGLGATGHHVFNALWYGLLCVVIFLFMRDLGKTEANIPWWFAGGVALIFAAHPLHTEAVANIKGRDETMAALGAIAGTWLIWRAAQRNNFWGAAAGAVVFFLGCLAKENTITFFVVIPAVLVLFGKQQGVGHRLKFFLPVIVATAGFLALRFSVIGFGLGSGPVMELMNNPFLELRAGSWQPLSTADRLATVMHTLWRYLGLLVAPFDLVHDYYPRAVPIKSWGQLTPWLGLLLHLGMGLFALLKWKTHRLLALGILIYLAALSIVSNVFFSIGTNMSERFLFLPSFGFILAAVTGIIGLSRRYYSGIAWAIPAIVLLFSVLTVLRNPAWKNDYTLFTTDVQRQPNSAKLLAAASGARIDRFVELTNDQRNPPADLLTNSINDLNRALDIHPSYRLAFQLRGNAHYYSGSYDAAIADYDEAFDLSGGQPEQQKALVIALTAAAEAGGKAGRPLPEIMNYLQRAAQLAPNDYNVLRLLGVANGMGGNADNALAYFSRALQLKPNDPDALWNYGVALYTVGRVEEAEQQLAKAEQIKPGIRAERQR